MTIFTIGFTKSSAEHFFERLRSSGTKRVIDVRLNNLSQLAAFAKKEDLRYFLKSICGIDYMHMPELAPTQNMLDAYKKQKGRWDEYERSFLALLDSRGADGILPREAIDGGCFLCSEEKPHHCHRRLVAEYLAGKWGNVEIVHL